MSNPTRTLAILAVTVVFGAFPPSAGADIHGADPEFSAVIEHAIDRYASAGLALPPLRVFVHPTKDGCAGHLGFYAQYGEADRIDLCTRSQFYVLHELAHAWQHHNLSEPTRQAFLDETGLVWYDPDVKWVRRGAEALANTVAWGLLDEPLSDVESHGLGDMLDRFQLLTGRSSPRIE